MTRKLGFDAPGAVVAASVNDALRTAGAGNPEEIAIIGGGEIYRMFLPLADRVAMPLPECAERFTPLR